MSHRYRSKPSEVEAIQWTGDNLYAVSLFGAEVAMMHDPIWDEPYEDGTRRIVGNEPNGELKLRAGKDGAQEFVPLPVGHWIVRKPGDLSDHWPVDPDYFAAKYERVEEFPSS